MNAHPANVAKFESATFGEKLADRISAGMGSWKFILSQAGFTVIWIVLNSVHGWHLMWDKYPWVLLNLVYSFQAGFTGPILLLSQNRQSEHDRAKAEEDLKTDKLSLSISRRIADHLQIDISDLE